MAVPLHQQLAEQLLGQISDGTIAIGDRLPTEQRLCEDHGLARGTVRRALERLDQLGMISRRAGAGTVVIADRPLSGYQPVAQSAADIATFAAETKFRRPETAEVKLDAVMARRLGARAGSTWFVVRGTRIRRTPGQPPVCWSENYLRADLPRELFMKGRFTVEEVASHSVEQIISAGVLDDAMAEALEAEAGGAALIITRRHFDRKGRLDSVGIHTHPADRYSITTTIESNDGSGS